jgi:hypothetical protein
MNNVEVLTDARSGTSPIAPQRERKILVDVGFDFGTHSTKVVIRRRDSNAPRVIPIEPSTVGYPWFVTPSLVRLRDGHVAVSNLKCNRGSENEPLNWCR